MTVEGGINYEVSISGGFDTQLKSFINDAKALTRQMQSLQKTSREQTRTRRSTRTDQEAKAAKDKNKELNVEKEIKKELLKASNQELKNASEELTLAKALTKVEREREKAAVSTTIQKEKSLKVTNAEAKAEQQNAKAAERTLVVRKQIEQAEARGAKTLQEVVRLTGLSEKAILSQSRRLSEIEAKRKQELVTLKQKEQAEKQAQKDLENQNKAQARIAQAQERIAKAEAQRTKSTTASGIAIAKTNKAVKQTAASAENAARATARIGKEAKEATGQTNKLLLSFRQVLFTVARFQIARRIFSFIGDAVNEMSRFSAEIEGAQTAMASIIATVAEVRDSSGQLAGGIEAFNAASRVSGQTIEELRQRAAKTEATFEGLVQAYQFAVGPGLAAGLNLDEILQTTVNITRAATQLGVPVRGLNEEIRSILSGTIRIQNTRLAAIITNEEVNRAREAGNLFEVLSDKLKVYEESADQVANTFKVLESNVRDSSSAVLASGGIEYFESLKGLLRDINKILVGQGDGANVINPQAVEIVKNIGDGLSFMVDKIGEFLEDADTLSALEELTETIGTGLVVAGEALAIVFDSLVTTINTLLAPVNLLVSLFSKLVGDAEGVAANTEKFLSFLLSTYTVSLVLGKTMLAIQATMGLMSKIMSVINAKEAQRVTYNLATGAVQKKNNVLLAIWNGLLDKAAIKTALISGGLTIALGALAVILSEVLINTDSLNDSMAGLKDQAESVTAGAEDLAKTLEGIPTSISSSVQFAKELQKLLDDIAKKGKETQVNLEIADTLKNVEGLTRTYLEAFEKGKAQGEALLDVERKRLETLNQQIEKNKEFLKLDQETAQISLNNIANLAREIRELNEETNKGPEQRLAIAEKEAQLQDAYIQAVGKANDEELKGAIQRFEEASKIEELRKENFEKEQKRVRDLRARAAFSGIPATSLVNTEELEQAQESLKTASAEQQKAAQELNTLLNQRQQIIVNTIGDIQKTKDLTDAIAQAQQKLIDNARLQADLAVTSANSSKRAAELRERELKADLDALEAVKDRATTQKQVTDLENAIITRRIESLKEETTINQRLFDERSKRLQEQRALILQGIEEQKKQVALNKDDLDGQARLISLKESLNNLDALIADNQKEYSVETSNVIIAIDRLIAKQNELNRSSKEGTLIRQQQAQQARGQAAAEVARTQFEIDQLRIRTSKTLQTNAEKSLQLKQLEAQEQSRIIQSVEQANRRQVENLKAQKEVAKTEEERLSIQEKINNQRDVGLAKLDLEKAKLQEINEELDQLTVDTSDSLSLGISDGFKQFAKETPGLSRVLSDTIKSGLEGVASTTGQVFADAIDPRKNADVETAFADLFYSLAGQAAEEITRQVIKEAITVTISQEGGFSTLSSAMSSLTAALGLQTTATEADTASRTTAAIGGTAQEAGGFADLFGGVGELGGFTDLFGGAGEAEGADTEVEASEDTNLIVETLNTNSSTRTKENKGLLTSFSKFGGLISQGFSSIGGLFTKGFSSLLGSNTEQSGLLNNLLSFFPTIIGSLFSMVGSLASIALSVAAMLIEMIAQTIYLLIISIATLIEAANPFSKGGLVQGKADGGEIKSFANGGNVPFGSKKGLRAFQKANDIPRSDTVPAMLTPGEFVMPVATVQKYGLGFMESLRSGSFKGSGHARGGHIKGYQTGGPVKAPFSAQQYQQETGIGLVASLIQESNVLLQQIAKDMEELLATMRGATGGTVTRAGFDFFASIGLAKGGQVKGYASGGSISNSPFPRPSSIPSSDTVPAWLTPGEFVLTLDAVKRYGVGFLSALNNGMVDPGAILGMPTAKLAAGHGSGIKGYADGGMVSYSSTEASPTTGEEEGGVTILPIMPVDNSTAGQIFSGGRDAFAKSVNRTTLTGDPNESKEWT